MLLFLQLMMSEYKGLEDLITINRKSYVLILDFINPLGSRTKFTKLNTTTLLDDDSSAYVSTSHCEKMRKKFPEAILTPFWLAIANSGLLSSSAIHYFYFNEDKTLGCYLITNDSKLVQSGTLSGGFLSTHYSIDGLPQINLNLQLNELSVSHIVIKTNLDIQLTAKRQLKIAKRSKLYGSLSGFSVGLFLALYLGLTYAHHKNELVSLQTDRDMKLLEYKTYVSHHTSLATTPNNFLLFMVRLLSLPNTSIVVPTQSMIEGANFAFVKSDSKTFYKDISFIFGDKLNIEFYSNDKGWRVSW